VNTPASNDAGFPEREVRLAAGDAPVRINDDHVVDEPDLQEFGGIADALGKRAVGRAGTGVAPMGDYVMCSSGLCVVRAAEWPVMLFRQLIPDQRAAHN